MKEKIIEIISQEQDVPIEEISVSTRFDTMDMDSLDFLCLLQAIGSELQKKRIPPLEILKVETVGQLIWPLKERKMTTYQAEPWETFIQQAKYIFPMHWRELALDQDIIPMDMDYSCYGNAYNLGKLAVITVRQPGELLGYVLAWLVPYHPHYRNTGLMASVDMFYLLPPYRKGGTGTKLLLFLEEYLKSKKVSKVSISCKVHQDHTQLFEALGWAKTDIVFSKMFIGSSK